MAFTRWWMDPEMTLKWKRQMHKDKSCMFALRDVILKIIHVYICMCAQIMRGQGQILNGGGKEKVENQKNIFSKKAEVSLLE